MTAGYITHDDGGSWRMFNLRGGISTFAFDPRHDGVIYAGNAGLWRSSDGGRAWSMVFPAPNRGTVEHQLGDHSDYVLTSADPVYPGGDVSAIAVNPADSSVFVAFSKGRTAATVVVSRDGGASWNRLGNLPHTISLLVPQAGGSVLAMAGATAYQLGRGGAAAEVGHIPGELQAVSAGQQHGSTRIYATNRAGKLYVSGDGGQHWTESTPALGQSAGTFEAIATSSEHPDVAYVGFRGLQLPGGEEQLYNGIAGTLDGGRTWRILFKESNAHATNLKSTWVEERASQHGESIWFDSPYSLGVAPGDPNVVYASDLFRTYRSLDGGATWVEVNSSRVHGDDWRSRGLDVTTNYGVQFDPFDPKHIFMDNTDMGLFQSRDDGNSWKSTSAGVPENWRNTTYWLAFDQQVHGHMWGAFSGVHDLPRPKMWRGRSPQGYTGGVGVSNDGGEHWTPSGTGMPSTSVTHILLDPRSPRGSRTLYATAFGRGVYKSTDDGKTWQLKNTGIAAAEPFAWRLTMGEKGELYLVLARRSEGLTENPGGDGALYRSTDGAEHWEQVPLPEGVNGPTALEIDPANHQRLYLTAWGREGTSADTGGGVYVSDDAGQTWRPIFTRSQHVYDVTIDPHNPRVLYICGFDAAAYRSTDAGAHWNRIHGYNFKWGHRVIIDPVHPNMIYITTYGGGVWHGPADGGVDREDVATPVPIAQR